jgi:ABC-type molybdate transport system substrate-binding protein
MLKPKVLTLFLVIGLFAPPSLVHAEIEKPTIRLISVAIPGLVNVDGSGAYLKQLFSALNNSEFALEIMPAKRATRDFSIATKLTCFFPFDLNSAKKLNVKTDNKLFSVTMNTSFAKLLSQRGTSPLVMTSDLNGKIVGSLLGFPIDDDVVNNAESIVTPTSITALLTMLKLGRIDYAYVYYPDVSMKVNSEMLEGFPESTRRFGVFLDSLACTTDLKSIVDRYTSATDAMYKDNLIQPLLGNAYTGR